MTEDWLPMKLAPKDGTAVRLRLAYPDGPRELPGRFRWLKPGTWPPRWHREDGAELFVGPHSFRLIDPPAQGALL